MSDDELPYARTVAVVGVALLALIISWFAVTAEDHPAPPLDPAIAEQRVPLQDGRTVLCLVFPTSSSCDWQAAR